MYFDRFDICAAYLALEYDWNYGGWLDRRPSCIRKRKSVVVQLRRVGYRPGPNSGSFDLLENDNQREIYVNAMQRFGYIPEQDGSIVDWIKGA